MLRCDSDHDITVRIEKQGEGKYVGYLKKLSHSAMDYASFNRAEVVITFRGGHLPHATSVLDTPDYDKEAIVLRMIPRNLQPPRQNMLSFEYKASAHFDINHHHYHHQHEAIEHANDSVVRKIFPGVINHGRSRVDNTRRLSTSTFPLDEEYQLTALKEIFSCHADAPYLLLGPFGTGKTYLLAAAVAKLIESRGNKVLVCTHRKRGADGIYRTLQEKIRRVEQTVARMVGGADAAERLWLPGASVVFPDVEAIRFSALITTFGVAGNVVDLVRQGQIHFSHILIDEGAQCPEPEALGALVLADDDTKIIVVGDNKQVGPSMNE